MADDPRSAARFRDSAGKSSQRQSEIALQQSTSHSSAFSVWLGLGAGALTAAFLSAALLRRLNFDELLALRAGRLELLGADTMPPFVMPFTLFAGWLSFVVDEPRVLFLLLRLLVSLAALLAFWFAATALAMPRERRLLAVLLVLAQSAFATHGLEFRYDAAILVGLLVFVAGMSRRTALGLFVASLALATVALHHAKGLLVAGLLLPLLLCGARGVRRGSRAVGLGLATVAGSWLILLASLGLTGRWSQTVRTFVDLASTTPGIARSGLLLPAIGRDLAWWLLALLTIAMLVEAWRRRHTTIATLPLMVAFAAALPVGFHPRPWAYMAALPAPFFALSMAALWPSPSRRAESRLWGWGAACALAAQLILTSSFPLTSHFRALRAPLSEQTQVLATLRGLASPSDRVLDPTGLAYFLVPCGHHWYVDTLFVSKVESGQWMQEFDGGIPADCRWVLNSYRLSMLPAGALSELRREFGPLAGPILQRHAEWRVFRHDTESELPASIENYW